MKAVSFQKKQNCESSGTSPLSLSSAPISLAHRPVSEMDGSGTCSWSPTHIEASLFSDSAGGQDESKSVWRDVEGQCSSSHSPSSKVNLASPGRVGRGREKSTRSLSLKLRNNKQFKSSDPSGSEVFITAEKVAVPDEEEDESDEVHQQTLDDPTGTMDHTGRCRPCCNLSIICSKNNSSTRV